MNVRSRYQPYDAGDSRGSPRDRTPPRYTDGRDSVQFSGSNGRGSESGQRISDVRANSAGFSSSRDTFRDSNNRDFSTREPPRGPKALIDPLNGPRTSAFSPDYRGRGRGTGRAMSWRDDSRDRGSRPLERDYRDRPAPSYRDDRSRDRDWTDRDRRERDGFRPRRPTPPPLGRGRSPIRDARDTRDARDSRDTRDARDVRDPRDVRDSRDNRDRDSRDARDARDAREREPLSIDLERSRRDSRDGPLSAGSSNDQGSTFSRGYRPPLRGRARPLSEWDSRRGRYYDERDRRSRSPENRWSRDDRDRDRTRDVEARDWDEKSRSEDREAREREAKRYKMDRANDAWNDRPAARPSNGDAPRTSASPRHDGPSTWSHDGPARDEPAVRRASSNLSSSDGRRPSVKPEQVPTRSEAPRDRFSGNPSPPPQAPQVPAFGSSVIPSRSASVSAALPKAAPTGPRADRVEPSTDETTPKSPALSHHTVVSPTLSVRSVNIGNVPTGPRADREQSAARESRPTSRQWVRPGLPTPTSRMSVDGTTTSPTSTMQSPPNSTAKLPQRARAVAIESRISKASRRLALNDVPPGHFEEPLTQAVEVEPESDSDSGEDLDDSYFASEIARVQSKLDSLTELVSIRDSFPPIFARHTFTHYPLDVPETISKSIGSEKPPKIPSPSPLTQPAALVPAAPPTSSEQTPTVPDANEAIPSVEMKDDETIVPPKVDDVEAIRASITEMDLEAAEIRMKTPPISSLPFGPIKRWQEDDEFLLSLRRAETLTLQAAVKRKLEDKMRRREHEIEELQRDYKTHYKNYRIWCASSDPVAIRGTKRLADRRAAKSGGVLIDTRPDGRRATSRFATERDFERVLRESEREAKEKEEQAARAAQEKAASDKEAVIPDMLSRQEMIDTRYEDTSEYVPWERTFARFEALPPIDNFTEEEAEKFEAILLEFPKQWGKIADALPGRTFQECIQHYYLVKHAAHLREKLRNYPRRRRRGRAAKRKSNALTADLKPKETEGEEAPEGETIAERRRPRRAAAPTWGYEAGGNDSDATPSATPGRRTPKNDSEGQAPKKGRKAGARERGPKASKNNNGIPVAVASPLTRPTDEEPLAVSEWQPPKSVETDMTPTPPVPLIPDALPPPFISQDRLTPTLPLEAPPPKASQNSSYWSVPEHTQFPRLLAHFGTDWPAIAKSMTSKSATMVKNFYQRQIESKYPDWREIAEKADQQRALGESTGPTPSPPILPAKKQRPDVHAKTVHVPGEMFEEMPAGQSVIMPQAAQPLGAKLMALPQAGNPVPTFITQQTLPTSKPPKQPKQLLPTAPEVVQPRSRGPTRGFFHADAGRAPLQGNLSGAVKAESPAPRRKLPSEVGEGPSDVQKPMSAQEPMMMDWMAAQGKPPSVKQEPERMAVHQYDRFPAQPPPPSSSRENPAIAQFISAGPPPPVAQEARRPTPAPPVVDLSRDPYRLPVQTSANAAAPSPPEVARLNSQNPTSQAYPPRAPSVRGYMSDAGPTGMPASPSMPARSVPPSSMNPPISRDVVYQSAIVMPPQQSAPAVPPPRTETVRKTSNIMSLLNDDPPEPRPPPKPVAEVDRAPIATSSPAPHAVYQQPSRQAPPPGQPTPIRRDLSLGDSHAVGQGYARNSSTPVSMRVADSPYAAPSQPPSRAPAGSPVETEREYYPRQPAYRHQQQSATASPQMAASYQSPHVQQAPLTQHRGGVYDVHNPSPPSQYNNYPPIHASRPSFDGRPTVSTPVPAPSSGPPPYGPSGHYAGQPQHGPLPPSRYASHPVQPPPAMQPQLAAHQPPPPQHPQHAPPAPYGQPQPPLPGGSRYGPIYDAVPHGHAQPPPPPPPMGMPTAQDRDRRMRMLPGGGYDQRVDDPYRAPDGRYDDHRR